MTARKRLAAIQARNAKVQAELAKSGVGGDRLLLSAIHLASSQSDVAPLVAALTAGLDEHDDVDGHCSTCYGWDDKPQPYPCATVERITAALEGQPS